MQLDSKNSSIFAVAELFPVPLVDTGDDNDNDLHHDFVDSHLVGSAKDIVDDLSSVCLEVSCCQFLGEVFSIFCYLRTRTYRLSKNKILLNVHAHGELCLCQFK